MRVDEESRRRCREDVSGEEEEEVLQRVVFGWPEEKFWTSTKKIGKDEEDETGFREKVREDEEEKSARRSLKFSREAI